NRAHGDAVDVEVAGPHDEPAATVRGWVVVGLAGGVRGVPDRAVRRAVAAGVGGVDLLAQLVERRGDVPAHDAATYETPESVTHDEGEEPFQTKAAAAQRAWRSPSGWMSTRHSGSVVPDEYPLHRMMIW